jgi:hypothetical protein
VKGREYGDDRSEKELAEMLRRKSAMPTCSVAVFVHVCCIAFLPSYCLGFGVLFQCVMWDLIDMNVLRHGV